VKKGGDDSFNRSFFSIYLSIFLLLSFFSFSWFLFILFDVYEVAVLREVSPAPLPNERARGRRDGGGGGGGAEVPLSDSTSVDT
jgi:hypothetical protein